MSCLASRWCSRSGRGRSPSGNSAARKVGEAELGFGRELPGIYRQAWEAIVTTVEAGGVDPKTFNAIINNTLGVLGPASDRRSEWRNNLVTIRNQATAGGNRNMVALLEAVIGLLDAGGDPAGLGEGLAGVYAKTWQGIVGQLPE